LENEFDREDYLHLMEDKQDGCQLVAAGFQGEIELDCNNLNPDVRNHLAGEDELTP